MNKHFRNAGIGLLAMGISFTVSAQTRYTDLEVIGISPSGEIKNGGTLPLIFKITNHGPDDEIPGDTTFYKLYQVEHGAVKEIYTGMLATGGARLVGESSYYRDNYDIGSFDFPDLKEPITLDFCFKVFTRALLKNGDTVGLSRLDTNSSNDVNCTKVTVIPRTTSIQEQETMGQFFNIYPNPADKVVLFRREDDTYTGPLKISISDLSGRILVTHQFNAQEVGSAALSLNVEQLPIGMFIVHIQTKAASASKRLTIIR